MFCPKCGSEAQEGQKFCKSCGVNLQLVSDALDSGNDTLGQLRLDVDTLTREAKEFFKNLKWNTSGVSMPRPPRAFTPTSNTNPLENKTELEKKTEPVQQPAPKAKDWLAYSWQHNLRDGIISLFAGAGLAVILYYVGRIALESGTVQDIEEMAGHPIRGLERLLSMLWMFALIPLAKGVGQILYAAFFAESIATLSERFIPQLPPQREPQTVSFTAINEPPLSVTEHTTQIFEPAPPKFEKESH